MPLAQINGTRLYYRFQGDRTLPVLVLSHSLGNDHGLWDLQMPDLLRHFQVLRYDIRGHGGSDAPPGDYSIEDLAGDVLALCDTAGVDTFAYCGLSLGGMVGQWLGVHAKERLTHLILANTSAKAGDPSHWDSRRRAALEGGMAAVTDAVLQRSFSPEFFDRGRIAVDSLRRVLLGVNVTGYAGCCAAIRDMNQLDLIPRIAVPTLVIGGDADISTPWAEHGQLLVEGIPGARGVCLPAGHLSNLERPRSFLAAVLGFLLPHLTSPAVTPDSPLHAQHCAS